MKLKIQSMLILLLISAALLAGCSSGLKPFTYQSNTEIKQGPGLFSGSAGDILLYDSKQPDTRTVPQPVQPIHDQPPAPAGQQDEEFRQFQEWSKEQKELERFRNWKQSPQGQKEYEEFQQWQRWQEFLKWRQAHPQDQ